MLAGERTRPALVPAWCFVRPSLLLAVPKALEKTQQWLAYDQQREAYVKAVLERTCVLEQQLDQANEALQQKDKQASSEGQLEG